MAIRLIQMAKKYFIGMKFIGWVGGWMLRFVAPESRKTKMINPTISNYQQLSATITLLLCKATLCTACPPPSTTIHQHPSPPISIHHQPSASITTHRHPSPSIITNHQPSPSINIHHELSVSINLHHHPSPSMITNHHPSPHDH